MIIVKKKSELIRFGLFLVLMGAMAYFVASRMETWRVSEQGVAKVQPATGLTLPQALEPGALPPALEAAQLDGADFFADFRMGREQSRGALHEELKGLMESQTADADVKKQASLQLLEVTRVASLEAKAERMVKAKGFEDVIVDVSAGAAQVVVKASSLSQQQFMQVMDMVSRVTGVKQSAILVMSRER